MKLFSVSVYILKCQLGKLSFSKMLTCASDIWGASKVKLRQLLTSGSLFISIDGSTAERLTLTCCQHVDFVT